MGSSLITAQQDGDQLHPQSNVDKMSSGHPLTDEVNMLMQTYLLYSN